MVHAMDEPSVTEGVGSEIHHPHKQRRLTPAEAGISPKRLPNIRAGSW